MVETGAQHLLEWPTVLSKSLKQIVLQSTTEFKIAKSNISCAIFGWLKSVTRKCNFN